MSPSIFLSFFKSKEIVRSMTSIYMAWQCGGRRCRRRSGRVFVDARLNTITNGHI